MRDKAPFRCKREKQNVTMLASARRAEDGPSLQAQEFETLFTKADLCLVSILRSRFAVRCSGQSCRCQPKSTALSCFVFSAKQDIVRVDA